MNWIGAFRLCICLAVLTIARNELPNKYNKHTEIDCLRTNRGRVVGESSCKPHNRLVDLKPMRGYEFGPSKVSVKQCDGNCPTGTSCQAVKTKKIEVHVELISLNEPRMKKCVAVEVEQHVRCRCKCTPKESDCNDRQMYDVIRCKCLCMEEYVNKMECGNKSGMIWDGDDCSCKCKMISFCSFGFEWSEKECKCTSKQKVCKPKANECNEQQMYDTNSCKCKCKEETENKIKCHKQLGMWWDDDDCCKCMMFPMQCTSGQTWSEAHCKCVRTEM